MIIIFRVTKGSIVKTVIIEVVKRVLYAFTQKRIFSKFSYMTIGIRAKQINLTL